MSALFPRRRLGRTSAILSAIGTAALCLLAGGWVIARRPQYLPNSAVRRLLLWSCPVGTSIEVVRERQGWRPLWWEEPFGCPLEGQVAGTAGRAAGTRSAWGEIGRYPKFGKSRNSPTVVMTCWAFDASGNLLDVFVDRGFFEPIRY